MAPLWNLPSSRRGIADLDADMINSIFDPQKYDRFEAQYNRDQVSFYGPNFWKEKSNKQRKSKREGGVNNILNLFDEE